MNADTESLVQMDDQRSFHEPLEKMGPIDNRKCTNTFCLVFLLISVTCWIGMGVYIGDDAIKEVKSIVESVDRMGVIDNSENNNEYNYNDHNYNFRMKKDYSIRYSQFDEFMGPSRPVYKFNGYEFAVCAVIGTIGCMVFVLIMRWVTGFIVWFMIGLLEGVLIIASFISIVNYLNQKTQDNSPSLGIAILSSLLLLFFTCLFYFWRQEIKMAIELIKEAAKAVSSHVTLLFFPIIQIILNALITVYTVSTFFAIVATQNNVVGDNGSNQFYHLFNALQFYWLIGFVNAFNEMVLAGVFASWYWTFDKQNIDFWCLVTSVKRTVKYHLGTLALGSFILMLMEILRNIINSIEKKMKRYLPCFYCCFQNLFDAILSFLKFFNRNIYIMTAVHGTDFCTGAKMAFNLLMRNLGRVVVLTKVTSMVFRVMKLFITSGSTLCFYVYMQSTYKRTEEFGEVVFAFCIVMYVISSLFFGVYKVAVDTLFLCFVEDIDGNDGYKRPFYMSDNLRKLLEKSDQVQSKKNQFIISINIVIN